MINKRIADLAERFWEEAGQEEPFPRRLEALIPVVKPVAVVSLPGLCPEAVESWLRRHGHAAEVGTRQRWLDGCLYANKGDGFLFVEETLPVDQRRVIVAHEFAHFLAEHEAPRRRMQRRLGPSLLQVLDADRTPTAAERLAASMVDVSTEPFVHFMDRAPDGEYVEPVTEVERRADELGLELLAPWRAVFAVMRGRRPWPGGAAGWTNVLQSQFGLPRTLATHYAERLRTMARGRLSFSAALGFRPGD